MSQDSTGQTVAPIPDRRRRFTDDALVQLEQRMLQAILTGDTAVETRLGARMQAVETSISAAVKTGHEEIMERLTSQDGQMTSIEAKVDAHEMFLRDKKAEEDEEIRRKTEQEHTEKLRNEWNADLQRKKDVAVAKRRRRVNRLIAPIYGLDASLFVGAFLDLINTTSTGFHFLQVAGVIILFAVGVTLLALLVRLG